MRNLYSTAMFLLLAAPVAADLKSACIDSPTAQEGIAACTQRIETEEMAADQLSLSYSNRAAWYFDAGDMEAAIADATRAIEIDPQNWRAYMNRSRPYRDTGRIETALADFDRLLELEVLSPEDRSYVLIERGNIHFEQEDYARALEDYHDARDLEEDAVVYQNIGVSHYRMGNYDLSIEAHEKALALDPGHVPSLTGRGEALEELGRYEAAMADYIRAMELDPEDWIPSTKEYMASKGGWDGPIDSTDTAVFREALDQCVRSSEC